MDKESTAVWIGIYGAIYHPLTDDTNVGEIWIFWVFFCSLSLSHSAMINRTSLNMLSRRKKCFWYIFFHGTIIDKRLSRNATLKLILIEFNHPHGIMTTIVLCHLTDLWWVDVIFLKRRKEVNNIFCHILSTV